MALPERKKPAERNKMIAAVVLGAIALISLAYMLLGSSSSPKPTTSNTNKRTPTSTVAGQKPAQTAAQVREQEGFIPQEIKYDPVSPPSVPEAGRNIFAFYVPPPPTPTPTPTPIPTPTPPQPNLSL